MKQFEKWRSLYIASIILSICFVIYAITRTEYWFTLIGVLLIILFSLAFIGLWRSLRIHGVKTEVDISRVLGKDAKDALKRVDNTLFKGTMNTLEDPANIEELEDLLAVSILNSGISNIISTKLNTYNTGRLPISNRYLVDRKPLWNTLDDAEKNSVLLNIQKNTSKNIKLRKNLLEDS